MEISSSYPIQDKQTKGNFFLLPIITKTYACTWMRCSCGKVVQEFIQCKNFLKKKLGCFWHFSYVYTIISALCILFSHIKEKNCFNKEIRKSFIKMNGSSFQRLLGQKLSWFSFKAGKRFVLEVLFETWEKEYKFS